MHEPGTFGRRTGRDFDLGLTVVSQLARDGAAVSLAAHLRLGVVDGVNITAGYGYLLPRQALPGRGIGPHGAISIPLTPGLTVSGEGSLLPDGGGMATIGLSHRLGVAGGSWFVSGGLGFTFERAEVGCGGGRLPVNGDWCAAPAAVFGIQGRF